MRRWRSICLFILIAVTACGHGASHTPLRAPNPNGCYVIVYERPQFAGDADVLNGPLRRGALDQLSETNNQNWHNRIRSLRVGTAATLKAYTGSQFTGGARQFAPGTQHPLLDRDLAGHIQSIDLTCDRRPGSSHPAP